MEPMGRDSSTECALEGDSECSCAVCGPVGAYGLVASGLFCAWPGEFELQLLLLLD